MQNDGFRTYQKFYQMAVLRTLVFLLLSRGNSKNAPKGLNAKVTHINT